MYKFRAFRVDQQDTKVAGRVESLHLDDLDSGDCLIRAAYSSINYKDALAATGKGKIITQFPRIAGIDVAGTIETSKDPRFSPGDKVLVTGYDLGVNHDGGYSEYVRVPAEWVVPLPEAMTLCDAMALGTAGFTAGLCVQRMQDNGQTPDRGPLVVTGASGGVGSIAVDILSHIGYQVTAVTGKGHEHAYLRDLGATQVLDRRAIEPDPRPLAKAVWGGGVDTVGGPILAWLIRSARPWANITAVGLAAGSTLQTSVMPFILRGVSLLGITSSGCPTPLRHRIWRRLATDLRPQKLSQIAIHRTDLDGLNEHFEQMLQGQVTGRIVVDLRP